MYIIYRIKLLITKGFTKAEFKCFFEAFSHFFEAHDYFALIILKILKIFIQPGYDDSLIH